jgi:hypothetical protein
MTTEQEYRNPYPGPVPFEQYDRDIFFARMSESTDLLSLVIANRAVLLYGRSGSGKTSLLNAGLIPLLQGEGFGVLPVARIGAQLPESIDERSARNIYSLNALLRWTRRIEDRGKAAEWTIGEFLKRRRPREEGKRADMVRVLIFDQFEELFTTYAHRRKDREPFFRELVEALENDPLLRIVFVLREEHAGRFESYARMLPDRLPARYRLGRLTADSALEAIVGPVSGTRRQFAPGVAEDLVQDLMTARIAIRDGRAHQDVPGEYVEPTQLQIVCRRLWNGVPCDANEITAEHLRAFGNVTGASMGFYDKAVFEAAQQGALNEAVLRGWIEDTLITPAGTRGIALREEATTDGIPNPTIDVLEKQHLIRIESLAGADWCELAHDRLIDPIVKSNAKMRGVGRPPDRELWPEAAISRWVEDQAYEASKRRAVWKVKRMTPDMLLQLLPSSREEQLEDWFTACDQFAFETLASSIPLHQIGAESYIRLEECWLEDMKKLQAYAIKMRQSGRGDMDHAADYYAQACQELSERLQAGSKLDCDGFTPVLEYLENRFMSNGVIDMAKAEPLIRAKAERLWKMTGGDAEVNWLIAETFVRDFYGNLAFAVLGMDIQAYDKVMGALLAGDPVAQIVNVFEITMAMNFLPAREAVVAAYTQAQQMRELQAREQLAQEQLAQEQLAQEQLAQEPQVQEQQEEVLVPVQEQPQEAQMTAA